MLRIVGIVCAGVYVTFVIVGVVLKTLGPALGVPLCFVQSATWSEIFYGPACTVGTCFALFVLAYAVELRFRRD